MTTSWVTFELPKFQEPNATWISWQAKRLQLILDRVQYEYTHWKPGEAYMRMVYGKHPPDLEPTSPHIRSMERLGQEGDILEFRDRTLTSKKEKARMKRRGTGSYYKRHNTRSVTRKVNETGFYSHASLDHRSRKKVVRTLESDDPRPEARVTSQSITSYWLRVTDEHPLEEAEEAQGNEKFFNLPHINPRTHVIKYDGKGLDQWSILHIQGVLGQRSQQYRN